jgi:mandelate racemase
MKTTRGGGAPELTISGLRVRPVDVVPERPVQTAAGTMATTPLVLVDLRTREGIVGCSYVRCFTIPAYASLRTMGAGATAEEAGEAVARGFGGVKLKVGGGTVAQDLEAIRAVRAAIGPEPELMIDYNQSLTVDEALDRLRALDDEGLAWIEEPTRADDYRGHAEIADAAQAPIQLGENWWGPADMEDAVAAGACDHATLDVMKLGGVRGWLTAAALAAQAGLPASSHTFGEFSVQLLAVTPTRHRLEYLDHAGAILIEPVRVVDGLAYPPDRPGVGLEWDEDAVRRWIVS